MSGLFGLIGTTRGIMGSFAATPRARAAFKFPIVDCT